MLKNPIYIYLVLDDFRATINLGREDLVQSLFANIAFHLENDKWGSKYPVIMNKFYKGKLEAKEIRQAIKEMKEIKNKLTEIHVKDMMWCFDEFVIPTPFADDLEDMSLSEYFINVKGNMIIDVILDILSIAKKNRKGIYVGNYYLNEIVEKIPSDKEYKTKKTKKIFKTVLIYTLFALFIKVIVSPENFNLFITKYLFWSFIAVVLYFRTQKDIKEQIKNSKKKNDELDFSIEEITFKKNLRSSCFDFIIDKIDCDKNFDGLKKVLKLVKIKDYENDLNKIIKDNNLKDEYYDFLKDNLKENNAEVYLIKNINKIFEVENKIYNKNYIYRVIKFKNKIYLFTLYIEDKKNEIKN